LGAFLLARLLRRVLLSLAVPPRSNRLERNQRPQSDQAMAGTGMRQ